MSERWWSGGGSFSCMDNFYFFFDLFLFFLVFLQRSLIFFFSNAMSFSNCVCNSLFLFQEKLVWFDLTYVECLCYVYFINFTFSQHMYWLFIHLPSPHISFSFDYLVWNYFNLCIIILHKPITFLRIIFINQSLHPFHLYIRCHGNCMVLIGVFFF